MPKTKTKKLTHDEPEFEALNAGDLADLIESSELSMGKKMAYLYMIARGTFSMDAFEGLMKELEESGMALEKEKSAAEAKAQTLQKEIDELEAKMPALGYLSALEDYQNVDKLIEHVSRDEEKKEISKLKSKTKKKK